MLSARQPTRVERDRRDHGGVGVSTVAERSFVSCRKSGSRSRPWLRPSLPTGNIRPLLGGLYAVADNGRGRWLLAHPLIAMAGLEVLFIAVIGGGALVLKLLLPGLPGYSVTGLSHAFLITCLNAVLILAFIAALRWWRATGFTRPSQWRDLRLYGLPGLLVLAPFVAGVQRPTATTLGLLVVG